jgi:hypothetical protein
MFPSEATVRCKGSVEDLVKRICSTSSMIWTLGVVKEEPDMDSIVEDVVV